jgi:predicted dehydrogenase
MILPSPVDAPDPKTAPAIRWGIVGVGWMADQFANGVNAFTASTVQAVSSRSLEKAQAFAGSHSAAKAYGSVAELAADPDVDVIHIASPHSDHLANALEAIAAGKNVLVEKPICRNASEARALIDAARAANVFVMEAMWTRYLPHMVEIKRVIADGEIGDVIALQADHGQGFPFDPKSRWWSPDLAGGALLDIGIYPVAFAHDILGVPTSITAVGQMTETNVDGHVSMIFTYGAKTQASLQSTMWAQTPTVALISGTRGRIEVDGPFYREASFRVINEKGVCEFPYTGVANGYAYEAAEVARRVTAGEKQSPAMTPEMTLEVMATLDEVRRQIGLTYPGE